MTDHKASVEDQLNLMRKDTLNATIKLEQINQKLDRKADTFLHILADMNYSHLIFAGMLVASALFGSWLTHLLS